MVRHRRPSTSSSSQQHAPSTPSQHQRQQSRSPSRPTTREQELGSMYDYLAKIILLGPSGTGKSCLLHRLINSTFRTLSSQTIGVEFASKIVKVGEGARRKRIKLQLWDTAGTERFRSVSRSYYRGAAGALLVYDISNRGTFDGLRTFLDDARALASPHLTVLLAGNKADLADDNVWDMGVEEPLSRGYPDSGDGYAPSSLESRASGNPWGGSVNSRATIPRQTSRLRATVAPEGREVSADDASRWASRNGIPVSVEVSALSGDGVEEVFNKLARMILTRIELGEIDPDDPMSGIQYGDSGGWGGTDDASSVRSMMTDQDGRGRRGRKRGGTNAWNTGLREWEEVFRLTPHKRRTCC